MTRRRSSAAARKLSRGLTAPLPAAHVVRQAPLTVTASGSSSFPATAESRSIAMELTFLPTLASFVAVLVGALLYFDGNLDALANRLTAHRDAPPTGAGPAVGGVPLQVARAAADDDDPDHGGASGGAQTASPSKLVDDNCLTGGGAAACARHALDAFRDAVSRSRAGTLGHPVRISYYGDSVVAGDGIPARLRRRMQQALGDGGPGFVFAMPPHRFCFHEDITRTSTGTWIPHAVSTVPFADGLYGVANAAVESSGGASVRIKVKTAAITNVDVYYLAQPGGGSVRVSSGDTEIASAAMAADTKAPGYAAGTIAAGTNIVELATTGKARIFGLALERATGAVVDNFGVVSVNAKNFQNNKVDHLAAEIQHRAADLVMIAIGANEAQWLHPGDQDMKDYQARFQQVLAPLRKGRPDASCLVISPLDQAEAKDGGYPSRPVMPVLVEAQRRAAAAVGCAFYDAYAWQGGKGGALKFLKKGYVGTDFQHLTHKGAGKMGDGLFEALGVGTGAAQ